MEKDIPVFKITIDEEYADPGQELGFDKIAHTYQPAIKIKGMAFKSEAKKLFFADDVKMRIAAPLMVPSKIYRYDEESGDEYYVEFTAEVIEQLYKKFMLNLTNKDIFNDEHEENIVQSYILESFLVDTEVKKEMVKKQYAIDVPIGSVFLVSQVKDKETYEYLVENDKTGFSIEGFLGMKLTEIINKNKKKMSKQKFNLPAGKHLIGNQYFTIDEEGEIVSVEAAEEVETKPSATTTEEEEMASEEEEMASEEEEMASEEEEMASEEEMESEEEEFEALTIETVMEALAPIHEDLINRIAQLEAKLELSAEKEDMENEEPTVMKTNLSEILKKAAKFSNIR
jgi:hypothetical protein